MPFDSRVIYPAKVKPKKAFPRRAVFGLLFLFALVLMSVGVWYALNLPFLRIERIEVRGQRLLAAAEIEQAVRDMLGGSYFGLAPRDSVFLISRPGLAEGLLDRYSVIERASVERIFPNRLAVNITERKLWGIYCDRPSARPEPGAGNTGAEERQCFYLDTRGIAYEKLSDVRGWLLPVIYAARPVTAGEQAAPPSTLQYFKEADAAVALISARILSMRLATTTADDVRFDLAEGWHLLVNVSRPVSDWGRVLGTVLDQEIRERRGELEYVDLRFGAKVFYRFKQPLP